MVNIKNITLQRISRMIVFYGFGGVQVDGGVVKCNLE